MEQVGDMAIKFICTCGKHLRAREEMAARRSVCPRCGAPVGIPSLRPTHAGTIAAPLSPEERRRLRRNIAPADSLTTAAVPPAVPALPQAEATPKSARRRGRHLETHWYECLCYPFLIWPRLFLLTLALSILTGFSGRLLPAVYDTLQLLPREQLLRTTPWLLIPLLILAGLCIVLQVPLTTALAGQPPFVRWPNRLLLFALASCVRWLICFLAGPAVLAGIALSYWFYGGDPIWLDRVILTELGVLAIGYGFLEIVAVSEGDRLRNANPASVARLLSRLGYRAVVPALIFPLCMLTHGLGMLLAVEQFHTKIGWLGLACCWGSVLFWAAFFFRLLGVWCYRLPQPPPMESGPVGDQGP